MRRVAPRIVAVVGLVLIGMAGQAFTFAGTPADSDTVDDLSPDINDSGPTPAVPDVGPAPVLPDGGAAGLPLQSGLPAEGDDALSLDPVTPSVPAPEPAPVLPAAPVGATPVLPMPDPVLPAAPGVVTDAVQTLPSRAGISAPAVDQLTAPADVANLDAAWQTLDGTTPEGITDGAIAHTLDTAARPLEALPAVSDAVPGIDTIPALDGSSSAPGGLLPDAAGLAPGQGAFPEGLLPDAGILSPALPAPGVEARLAAGSQAHFGAWTMTPPTGLAPGTGDAAVSNSALPSPIPAEVTAADAVLPVGRAVSYTPPGVSDLGRHAGASGEFRDEALGAGPPLLHRLATLTSISGAGGASGPVLTGLWVALLAAAGAATWFTLRRLAFAEITAVSIAYKPFVPPE